MKIKNIIGMIFFALMGMFITVMVFYPYALEYFGKGPDKHFGTKEGTFLAIAVVFFYGSAKFEKLASFLIDVAKKIIQRKSNG